MNLKKFILAFVLTFLNRNKRMYLILLFNLINVDYYTETIYLTFLNNVFKKKIF